jgi:plasmid stabilization system protein ParE
MAFRVEIAPQAFEDLDSIADYIRERSSFAVAEKWFNGIIDDIASLRRPVSGDELQDLIDDLTDEAATE